MLRQVAWTVATVGGLGFCPLAPGTAGSFLPTLIVLAMRKSVHLRLGIVGALVVATLVALPVIQEVLKDVALKVTDRSFSKKRVDPSFIVLDEVIGQLLTFALVSYVQPLSMLTIVGCFGAFRFFDIVKPWPIRTIERSLEQKPPFQALSVVLDDVLAGLFAAASVIIGKIFFD